MCEVPFLFLLFWAQSIGGPWGASSARGGSNGGGGGSGFGAGGSGFGRNSGPMDSAAIHALLSDTTKSKILMGNLLSERIKEVGSIDGRCYYCLL